MVIVKNHENRLMECLFNNRQREREQFKWKCEVGDGKSYNNRDLITSSPQLLPG